MGFTSVTLLLIHSPRVKRVLVVPTCEPCESATLASIPGQSLDHQNFLCMRTLHRALERTAWGWGKGCPPSDLANQGNQVTMGREPSYRSGVKRGKTGPRDMPKPCQCASPKLFFVQTQSFSLLCCADTGHSSSLSEPLLVTNLPSEWKAASQDRRSI